MKGKFPAFQFYPDAWLSSTTVSLMSPAEEGAYLRLLCHAWQSDDCGLPDDDEALASLSRLGIRQWNKSRAKIRSKFESVGGRLFNPRLIEERQKQLEWREKSAQGGRKSTARKSSAINKDGQPHSNHPSTTLEPPLQNGCGLVGTKQATNGQPTPQPKTDISSSSSSSLNTYTNARVSQEEKPTPESSRFPEWLSGYHGRKADPEQALRAWLSVNGDEHTEVAFACRDRYNASAEVERGALMEAGKFIFQQGGTKWRGEWQPARTAALSPSPIYKQVRLDDRGNVIE